MMKAIVFEQPGDFQVLKWTDVDRPAVGPTDVLVKIAASGVNHVDLWVRKGSPAYPVQLPHVPGCDGAGVIEEVGPEVEGLSVGDRVLIYPGLFCGHCRHCRAGQENQCDSFSLLGAKRWGTYAEFVAVPDSNVIPLPDNFPFDQAAAIGVAYLTAWHMVVGKAKLKKDEAMLVVGAGGGVSLASIQIGKYLGAGKVLAVTTSEKKVSAIKSAGATDVLVSQDGKFSEWVLQQTSGRGVPVVVENVGPATWEASLKSVERYGRIVTCGATTGPAVQLELRALFGRDISLFGARLGTQREFQTLTQAVFDGKIRPIIDRTFPLSDAAQAHLYLEEKRQIGKVVLTSA